LVVVVLMLVLVLVLVLVAVVVVVVVVLVLTVHARVGHESQYRKLLGLKTFEHKFRTQFSNTTLRLQTRTKRYLF